MITTTNPGGSAATTNRLADQAAQNADDAIKSTQRVANDVLDRLSDKVQDTHDRATPKLAHLADQAEMLARRGVEAVREGSHQLREKASHTSDQTIAYIRDEPVKAVLIAAATGAALMALVGLLSRSRH
jgi:ElaB/YqjD/DUF883 family membrane-anchored ribosome-binding protein